MLLFVVVSATRESRRDESLLFCVLQSEWRNSDDVVSYKHNNVLLLICPSQFSPIEILIL
jgi:hypothetical protein